MEIPKEEVFGRDEGVHAGGRRVKCSENPLHGNLRQEKSKEEESYILQERQ